MPDARALREITDALRVLKDRAQNAGSPKLRAFIGTLIPVAEAEAEAAERGDDLPARRPEQVARRFGVQND